ncbi:hypothetical protein [Bradymonas sediminis]|uniref:Uncharacterized protein n=1 Tax=Bradymonas sediminis TaxID=1548548 RepID=A0A2Z4FIC7_9DELT|nr:hypothetical protein [Bradymonas sediminis]AWV88767.1 hypothetical protein DN745_05205 [Bradymonas sediminis]TDP61765.1 hypothetical protein DFR33_1164 [Bradymonas sediminis]
MSLKQFSSWFPLDADGVAAHAPEGAAALQVRVAEGLIEYASGQASAMVFYCYASDNARETLQKLFADELAEPGARGHGELWFRYIQGDEVLETLKRRMHKFQSNFGEFPLFNQPDK